MSWLKAKSNNLYVLPSVGLLIGFGAAVGIRVIVGGRLTVASSACAGLIFAACLVALSWPAKVRTRLSLSILCWGLLGAAVVCVPIILFHLSDITNHGRPDGNYLMWSVVVAIVAAAEELFLRGALYVVLQRWVGTVASVVVGAMCFAGLHVPLYGWHVVPLDFVVGLWFGTLRQASGSWMAPAIAHIVADLCAWWIV